MIRPRIDPATARLSLVAATRRECVLGAHQRAASAVRTDALAAQGYALTRRASGGPAVLVDEGTLHLTLSLPRHDALTDCPRDKLQNRYVRPLLRALRRLGLRASYFGRDWISAGKLPVAWIGSALYDDGAAWVEAIMPLAHPFALPAELDAYPPRALDPFLGSSPTTLGAALGRPIGLDELTGTIVAEYTSAYGPIASGDPTNAELRPDADDTRPLWDVVLEEAIGFVGAARTPEPEVGGDLFASERAIRRLSALLGASLGQGPGSDGRMIDDAVRAVFREEVIDGVRDARTVTRAIVDLVRTYAGPSP